jgi:hypothetical protein
MNLDQWWNDDWQGKPEVARRRKLLWDHFVHNQSHMTSHGINAEEKGLEKEFRN